MPQNERKFYEFANFRLDVSRKILLRDDQPVALTPKVFDTLEILIENAGNLLAKDELMRKIWHDHFVEESNLTSNIKMLRKALGDDTSHPRFIETVPRRGYRFIAAVHENVKESAPPISRTDAPGFSVFRKSLLLAAVLILVAVFVGIWNARTASRASELPILSAPFHLEPLTTDGKTHHAVISPDGKTIAYVNGGWRHDAVLLKGLK